MLVLTRGSAHAALVACKDRETHRKQRSAVVGCHLSSGDSPGAVHQHGGGEWAVPGGQVECGRELGVLRCEGQGFDAGLRRGRRRARGEGDAGGDHRPVMPRREFSRRIPYTSFTERDSGSDGCPPERDERPATPYGVATTARRRQLPNVFDSTAPKPAAHTSSSRPNAAAPKANENGAVAHPPSAMTRASISGMKITTIPSPRSQCLPLSGCRSGGSPTDRSPGPCR